MKKSIPCRQTAAKRLQSEFSSFFSIILLFAVFAALSSGCGSGSGSNGQNNSPDSTAGDQQDQDVSPDENPAPDVPECGGVDNLECEAGFICVDDESDNCFPDLGDLDCAGVCVEEPPPDQIEPVCGLGGDPACPEGQTCADVEDDCDPLNGGVDCPTECIDSTPSGGDQTQNYIIGDACAGWDGLGCIAPFTCIDDPADDCDLATDNTCPGICVLWQIE